MRWELRLQRDGYSIDAAAIKGREFPEWYLDTPPMLPGDEFYLRAFWQLSTCRRYQGGPIAWDTTMQYAAAWELSPDMTSTFVIVMRHLDNAFLVWWADEQERLAEQKKAQAGTAKSGLWSRIRNKSG